jgi:hypothetical protein
VVFWTSLAVWVVAALGWITLIAGEGALMSLTSCEYPAGDSIYGEASWSWFPPGVRCTWQLELNGRQVEVVESPSVARLGTAAVLVLWGASTAALGLVVLPRDRPVAAAPPPRP